VFWPEVIVVPEGTLHVYDVAPETGFIEYVAEAPLQRDAGPVIEPAAEGAGETVTTAVLLPVQPLAAVPVTV
jgi:hypothetical protein